MFWRAIKFGLLGTLLLFIGESTLPQAEVGEQVRAFTRPIEFDYVNWTLDALGVKWEQANSGESEGFTEAESRQFVRDYMALIAQIQQAEADLGFLIADPERKNVALQISSLEDHLESLHGLREQRRPVAESILQEQLSLLLGDFELTIAGQPIPPVLFHSTPLPWALIVSPRERIEQEANISLETELTLGEHISLEEEVSASLDVSVLVVPVGGIGSYPTMVAESSHLNWIAEVVAHEWIHNYLTLRPLGLLYERNQELRTMNETAANIAGKELGAALIERFYPELVPAPVPIVQDSPEENVTTETESEVAIFDFRAEMHSTRLQVDAFLAEGEVEEAEVYMEERRLFFRENGYSIRKINQAYFAFYGSYADQPSGPAGDDPVGETVRLLRAQSSSLAEFLKTMAFITSFEALSERVN
jgi:hypothetical protein